MLGILMAAHLAGVVLWAAGTAVAARLALLRAGGELFSPGLERLEKDALFKAGHGGMTAAILTGALMLTFNPDYFLAEGWMRAKLLLAAAAIVATVGITVLRKRLAGSPSKQAG